MEEVSPKTNRSTAIVTTIGTSAATPEAMRRRILEVMVDRGLLIRDPDTGVLRRAPVTTGEAVRLSVIARSGLQALERYYVTVALLLKHGPGVLTQKKLEELFDEVMNDEMKDLMEKIRKLMEGTE